MPVDDRLVAVDVLQDQRDRRQGIGQRKGGEGLLLPARGCRTPPVHGLGDQFGDGRVVARGERVDAQRVGLGYACRRKGAVVEGDHDAMAGGAGDRSRSGRLPSRLAGPSALTAVAGRIAPVMTTGLPRAVTRSRKKAVSSIVSVPWVMTMPSTAASASLRAPVPPA